MWIFSRHGFFSVVAAQLTVGGRVTGKLDPDTVMIRARVRQHLENLRNQFDSLRETQVRETGTSDYRYRLLMTKPVWLQIASELAAEVDYGNFKNACARSANLDNHYLTALHDVWAVHHALQERASRPA